MAFDCGHSLLIVNPRNRRLTQPVTGSAVSHMGGPSAWKLTEQKRERNICFFGLVSKEKEKGADLSIPGLLFSKLAFENNLSFLGEEPEEVIENPGVFY